MSISAHYRTPSTKLRPKVPSFAFQPTLYNIVTVFLLEADKTSFLFLGTGEPGGLPSLGLHRVGHNRSDLAAAAAAVTCLLRNLYASQEATVRTRHGTMDWLQTGKGVLQGCTLSPCLFNLYVEYIMKMRGWRKHKLESGLLGEISTTSDTHRIAS